VMRGSGPCGTRGGGENSSGNRCFDESSAVHGVLASSSG
jgi:hypothetical protein